MTRPCSRVYPLFLLGVLLFNNLICSCWSLEEEEEETIDILVGFHDRETEVAFVKRQQSVTSATIRGGKTRKPRIKQEFRHAPAIAMSVTPEELEELRLDPSVKYIEQDRLVHKASSSFSSNNATTAQAESRDLLELISYGIFRVQGDEFIPHPPPEYSQQDCVVNVCVVDSGLIMSRNDIPYQVGGKYVKGEEFNLPSGQYWHNPVGTDHGTGVAGIIIAKGGNDEGIVGVIPDGPEKSQVCLMIARVFADNASTTSISSIVSGTEWCADNGAHVINLSVAADFKTQTEEAIYNSIYQEQGSLLIAAAGNDGNSNYAYPASHDSVMSIASIDSQFKKSSFSQFNDKVELSAPGANILSLDGASDGVDGFYGTSYAAPFVAGVAAKIWATNPTCTNTEIRQALTESAFALGDDVPNEDFGYGLVQAVDAYNYMIDNFDCATPPCKEYLGTCVTDQDCCFGYSCRQLSLEGEWACRKSASSIANSTIAAQLQPKPRLSQKDSNGNCRGGHAGGCTSII